MTVLAADDAACMPTQPGGGAASSVLIRIKQLEGERFSCAAGAWNFQWK